MRLRKRHPSSATSHRVAGKETTTPVPERRQVPRERLQVDERRSQLLDLGLKIFSERAYDDVSIDDLAGAAGISKGLLYHYFPTKRDLYVAALDLAARLLVAEVEAESSVGSQEEQATRAVERYLSFVEKRGRAYLALMRGGIGSDPEVAAIIERTRRGFAEQILARVPDIGPLAALTVRGWIGFVENTSIDWVQNRTVPRERFIALTVRVLFAALQLALN